MRTGRTHDGKNLTLIFGLYPMIMTSNIRKLRIHEISRSKVSRERKCADTIGTVPVPWAHLLWFEITKMLIAVKKFIVPFITIFGTLSFPVGSKDKSGNKQTDRRTDTTDCSTLPANAVDNKTPLNRR